MVEGKGAIAASTLAAEEYAAGRGCGRRRGTALVDVYYVEGLFACGSEPRSVFTLRRDLPIVPLSFMQP
jgi:hypothetical protein